MSSGSKLKVLMVEDSDQDVELILRQIRRNGAEIHSQIAQDEAELRKHLTQDWDIVICDYNLPRFDAIRAIELIKGVRPHLPILVVSGSVGEEIAVDTIRAGASDFIVKSNLVRLLPAIERGLRERDLFKEHLRTELVLKEKDDNLRQVQKMDAVGQLAGGIAHDFNNIIAIIFMQVDTLLDCEELAPNFKENLSQIRVACERAKNLTRQLLAFGRKQVTQPKILNLNDLVASMSWLQPMIEANVEFKVESGDNLKNIYGDTTQIEQILLNLVVNARDAMPKGGTITITTQNIKVDEFTAGKHGCRSGDYVCLSLSDTGCGINSEIVHRIFEPFFTTKEVGRGTGLGLAMVYGIVKHSHGFVTVKSELGKGTTFAVNFPVSEGVKAEVENPSLQVEGLTGCETILFVEDEQIFRETVCQFLRGKGYNVLTAESGVHALSLAKSCDRTIDLVITDVVMPKMGGATLANEFASLSPTTKFIFQSGYTEDTLLLEGMRSGEIEFLQKPYAATTLLSKLRKVLNGKIQ